ncbi:MAG: hypothetical protein JWP29_3425 [Rhodoferax sp.]|nr:hypothetical protein [Rhodoferax sp.]
MKFVGRVDCWLACRKSTFIPMPVTNPPIAEPGPPSKRPAVSGARPHPALAEGETLAAEFLEGLPALLKLTGSAVYQAGPLRRLAQRGTAPPHTDWAGQCVAQDKTLRFDAPAADSAAAACVLLLPTRHHGEVVGVLSCVGSVFTDDQQCWLETMASVLGRLLAQQARITAVRHDPAALAAPSDPSDPGPADARWTQVTDALPLAAYLKTSDAQGRQRFVFVNQRVEQVLGVTAAALMADAAEAWRHVHPDDKVTIDHLLAGMEAALRHGEAVPPSETRVRLLIDSETRWVVFGASATPPDAAGDVAWGGYFQDVTAQTRAQEKLVESEAYGTMLFHQSKRAMMVMDPAAGYIDANAAAIQLCGYTLLGDLLGKNPLDLSPPVQAEGVPSGEAVA